MTISSTPKYLHHRPSIERKKMKRLSWMVTSLVIVSLGIVTGTQSAGAAAAKPQTATIILNWFAQAEQGGYWDAMGSQPAKSSGITIVVKQGGPGIQTLPQVAAGAFQFGVGNADEVLQARANGLPIVAIAAGFDTNLQCMMYHSDQKIKSFSDVSGHQVARVPSPYFDYIKAHFKLTGIKDVNFTGSMADFKLNDNLVQQCFVTSEPYVAKLAGVDIGYLSVAKDGGYNPYGNLLFTTEAMIKKNPILVRAVASAVVNGWSNLIVNDSVAKAAAIAANKDVDPAAFDYAVKAISDGGFLGSKPGAMTLHRWKVLRDQLVSIKAIPAGLDYTKAFTNRFNG